MDPPLIYDGLPSLFDSPLIHDGSPSLLDSPLIPSTVAVAKSAIKSNPVTRSSPVKDRQNDLL